MADNTIGSANLHLSADPVPLQKGLDQATGMVSAWAVKLTDKISYIGGGWIGALVAGASTGIDALKGIKDRITSVFSDIGEQDLIARRFGLGIEQFQTLMAGAKVDAEGLGTALRDLSRNTSGALAGRQADVRSFQELGIAVDDLQGKSLDEVFMRTAQALHDLPNSMDRTRIAMELFGRHGAALLPAINAGMGEAITRARQLGLILTNEQAANIRATNRAWADVGRTIKGIWQQLAAALAPLFLSMAQAAQQIWARVGPPILRGINVVGQIASVIGPMIVQIVGLIGDMVDNWEQFESLISGSFIFTWLRAVGNFYGGLGRVAVESTGLPALGRQIIAAGNDIGEGFWDGFAKGFAGNLTSGDFWSGFVSGFFNAENRITVGIQSMSIDAETSFASFGRAWTDVTTMMGDENSTWQEKTIAVLRMIAQGLAGLIDVARQAVIEFTNKFTVPFLKSLEDVITGIADMLDFAAGALGPIMGDQFRGMANGFRGMATGIHGAAEAAQDLSNMLADMGPDFDGIDAFFDELADTVSAAAYRVSEDLTNAVAPVLASNKQAALAIQGSKDAVSVMLNAQFGNSSPTEDRQVRLQEQGNVNTSNMARGIDQLVSATRNQPQWESV